jgi:hypothetical protein
VATPDPQSLRSALAEAPSSDYVEADSTVKGEGPLDASAYASFSGADAAKQQQLVNGLNGHHFVGGYGRIWVKKAASTVLVEQILAFADQSNAQAYEGASKLSDTGSALYTGSVDTSSVPNSYGIEQLTGGFNAVAIVFVKGNDLLVAGFVSSGGYMVADTVTQAQALYASAPDYSIRPASAVAVDTQSAAYRVGEIAGSAVVLVLVIGLIVIAARLMLRGRRLPAAAPVNFNLSGDGRYWWDGASWQDTAVAAPPSAQRSPDGAFWWDGRVWRPVPQQPMAR